MFLRELPRALLRRWYLVLLGLALAGVGAYLAWDRIEPRYSAESSTLMLPPVSATKAVPPDTTNANPLLYLGGLGQARDALISALASDAAQKDFETRFPDTKYEIVPDSSSNAPIIVMSAEAPTSETALAAVRYVAGRVDAEFANLQRELSVDKEEQIRSMPLTTATLATPNYQPQIRGAAVLAVGITALTVLLVGLIDGLLMQRRKRLAAKEAHKRAYPEDEGADGPGSATSDEPTVADGPEPPDWLEEEPELPEPGDPAEQDGEVLGVPEAQDPDAPAGEEAEPDRGTTPHLKLAVDERGPASGTISEDLAAAAGTAQPDAADQADGAARLLPDIPRASPAGLENHTSRLQTGARRRVRRP